MTAAAVASDNRAIRLDGADQGRTATSRKRWRSQSGDGVPVVRERELQVSAMPDYSERLGWLRNARQL